MNTEKTITPGDREVLRNLAKRQMEIARSPQNMDLVREWRGHNAFRGSRPLIILEKFTLWDELAAPLLACETPAARVIEGELYTSFLNQELFGDDWPVRDYHPVRYETWLHMFGYKEKSTHAPAGSGKGLGYKIEALVGDLEQDYDKLLPSRYGVDKNAFVQKEALLNDVLSDILPVRRVMGSLGAGPTQRVVRLMGMEAMMYAICDYPGLFKQLMARIADDYTAYFKWMEAEGLLLPTADAEYLGQSSFCYTDELPDDFPAKRKLTTRDVWGFMESQETVCISPDMFGEFIFPCYRKIAGLFGLLSYGCCEPVHLIWDKYISELPGIRKVTVSPWCDEEIMGERLRGKRVVYFRKPHPNYLAVGNTLDEGALREHFKKTFLAARGCTLEFAQRDVYTLGGNIEKARRYIAVFRESADRYWQG